MISNPELQDLLQTTETYCAELPTSTGVPQDINHYSLIINHYSLIINHYSLPL
jgi:hypothetical protein